MNELGRKHVKEALKELSLEEILEVLIDELQITVDANEAFPESPELIKKLLNLIYWWNPTYFKDKNCRQG